MNTNIEVLRELDELVEAARLLGGTQTKKLFGCYTDEDSRFERAMYESIDKHRAALLDWAAMPAAAPQQPASVDEVKEPDLWRCTVCGRIGTVGRCCGEETRERANMEQLLAENERLMRELRRETERRWEGNRRAAQEYVEDIRDVLREAAQVCRDLDYEAMNKENRLACGAECAAAIADLAARMNVPFERAGSLSKENGND